MATKRKEIITERERALILATDCEHVMRLASECLASRERFLAANRNKDWNEDWMWVSMTNVFTLATEVLRSEGRNGLAAFRLGQLALRLRLRGLTKFASAQKASVDANRQNSERYTAQIRKDAIELKREAKNRKLSPNALAELIHANHPLAEGERQNGFSVRNILKVLKTPPKI